MLDRARSGETVDFVAEFAGKLPMDVISELMGVPFEDRDRIRAMADGVMHREDGVNDVPQSAIEASINLMVYYHEMIADRRKRLTDDLTSALLEAEIDGDRLTDEEVLGFLFLMVIAGNETTTKLLANAAFWGHRNPDQLCPLYHDLEKIPLSVEETLRYDTSSQLLARVCPETSTSTTPPFPMATSCCCSPVRRTATSECSPIPTTTSSAARSVRTC